MLQAVASLHEQVIFIPPWLRSTLNVHRGTISQLVMPGMVPVVPWVVVIPGMLIPVIPVRSVMSPLAMVKTPFSDWPNRPIPRHKG
jgi:hypothetical protein